MSVAKKIAKKRLDAMHNGTAKPPELTKAEPANGARPAEDEVLGILETPYEKPDEKFRKTWNPTVVKILVGLAILAGLAILVWLGIFFFGTKGVADAVVGRAMK